ncbi:uncharacterized protein PITG_03742 [Phytophthora infestans T30-4]|uniref:Uncharacterized protein n=1 Tax=Phytophthora infestans (strain T30-4) TaxID=403677 RepID=D0MYE1_PHYIT|nr:uncharacterized protein PITG_03742 [Phytophthora infestans T30-4]EEY66189.1 conserved hypothetical protein [Phytophthora infestans T30-4]|eukprot:XP_002906788.1 conserved hypothetical protein [Phytophthora infestans T30-4]
MGSCPGTTSASPLGSPKAATLITAAPEQPVHDAETMCRYPSKKCWNPRALKRNGEHHNLCDFHRQKANKNQRRLELKRKARAQASADAEPLGKRLRAKKPRQRARRAPLSAHLAMKEEARAKHQAEVISRANTAAAAASSTGLTSWFLQDLVLLDGVYDRSEFQGKGEQSVVPMATPSIELQRLPHVVDEEVLDHILQDGQADAAALCKSLDTTLGLEALSSLPEGKTSPVNVSETWDNLDFGDYWLTPMPSEQPIVSSDASVFGVDEDVFVADV